VRGRLDQAGVSVSSADELRQAKRTARKLSIVVIVGCIGAIAQSLFIYNDSIISGTWPGIVILTLGLILIRRQYKKRCREVLGRENPETDTADSK
jgi:hypothetical protein